MAQGEYIALLASDDFLLPGGIQARVDYLQEHTDKLAVFADCVIVDDKNNLIHRSGIEDHKGRKRYLLDDNLLAYEIIFHWCVPGPVFMAKRETYNIVGMYDETLAVEDRDYYLRLVSINRLGFLDYPVAAYRIHDKSNTIMLSQYDRIKWPLDTVLKNLNRFTGLKRFGLIPLKILKLGEKYSFDDKRLVGIMYRISAKLLRILVNTIYDMTIFIRMNL